MKEITIAATGADVASLDDFEWFQGDLKILSEENYLKLKSLIIEFGFIAPMFVWQKDNSNFLLDGHQRILTCRRMRDEGYRIPYLPYCIIEAEDEEEARRKLLAITSQFGKITEEGIASFVNQSTISLEELRDGYELGPVDFDRVHALLEHSPGREVPVDEHVRTVGKEDSKEKIQKAAESRCPHCGEDTKRKPDKGKKTKLRKRPGAGALELV